MDAVNGGDEFVYKYSDLIRTLLDFKGRFVVILDICHSGAFVDNLEKFSSQQKARFTVFTACRAVDQAWRPLGSHHFTNIIESGLACTYLQDGSGAVHYPADANNDGLITLLELGEYLYADPINKLAQMRVYGDDETILFQFASTSLTKASVELDFGNNKSYDLSKNLKTKCKSKKQTVKWKSSDSSVASVSASGTVTAKKPGTVKITAYFADSKGNMCLGSESSCTVKVLKPEIILNKSVETLYIGQTLTIGATLKNLTGTISWSSSSPAKAYVSSSGVVSAKKEGTVTIKATCGPAYATCQIIVKKPTISLDRTKLKLCLNDSYTIHAIVNGKKGKAAWTTSNKNLATVKDGVIKTKSKTGTVKITAKANGVSASCTVTIIKKKSERLTYPKLETYVKEVALVPGTGTNILPYLPEFGKRYTIEYSSPTTWMSSNSKVVSVERGTGGRKNWLKAHKKGTATITISYSGSKTTVKVYVIGNRNKAGYFNLLSQREASLKGRRGASYFQLLNLDGDGTADLLEVTTGLKGTYTYDQELHIESSVSNKNKSTQKVVDDSYIDSSSASGDKGEWAYESSGQLYVRYNKQSRRIIKSGGSYSLSGAGRSYNKTKITSYTGTRLLKNTAANRKILLK